MREIKYFCDHCKKEIKDYKNLSVGYDNHNKNNYQSELELCEDCFDKITSFIKNFKTVEEQDELP